ncbi:glycosyltransferase [Candidatus Saccharibacteria bacterium]|nr:glycosyltransferase [Candidatus Saccharibacteria bacterium]
MEFEVSEMNTVFLLLENHFFKTPDGRIWCDRIISYDFLQRYLQSFDQVMLCGRCMNISQKEIKGKNLVSGKGILFVALPDFTGASGIAKNFFRIRKIIKKSLKSADCTIVRTPSPLSLAAYPVFKKSPKPFAIEFVMAADKMFDSDKLLYRLINKVLVKRARKMCLAADGVAYVTERILQEIYPCKKTAFTATYSSVDLKSNFFYRQKWDAKQPPKCFNIVHTGYMDSNRKGQDILIDAAKKMVDSGQTNFKITFIGDGKMRSSLEKMAADYKLEKYVKFVGAINEKSKIRDILINSHLFVFPSRSEGLPRALIEAMAVGLVCIASPTDGIPEILDEDYLVNRYKGDDYAEKIIEIMNNWPAMIAESRKNNERAKAFKKEILDKKRINFYDELKKMINRKEDINLDKRKITLVISQLFGGGAERVTCNLANYLDRNGYKIDIITMAESKDAYKINDGVKEICLLRNSERRNVVFNNILRHKRLKQYVKTHRDISCYVTMLSLPSFILTSLRKNISGNIIVSERCNPSTNSFLNGIMMKYAIERCDGLVVQTKEIANWYKDVDNKAIIPNAINEDVRLPKRSYIEKKIVAVGRLEKQKNYPMLIRAFAVLSEYHPDYKLEIYGKGSQEKKLKNMVKKYKLGDKVLFEGYVKDVSERIADATCFAMTSDYEGISNALIEAMCIGMPCVVTDSDGGGAKGLITDNINGFIIRKGDINELLAKMNLIISDNKKANCLANNAKKIRKQLSSEVIYADWLSFIKQTMEGE